jgi:hypothetical protein
MAPGFWLLNGWGQRLADTNTVRVGAGPQMRIQCAYGIDRRQEYVAAALAASRARLSFKVVQPFGS